MKKIAALVLAFAALAFSGACDYDSAIVAFEKRMNVRDVMKGAERAFFPDPGGRENSGMVRMRSKPLPSGRFMGLVRSEAFIFVDCMLMQVVVTHGDPKTKEVAHQATAYLREDGNLRAICSGQGDVTVENPVDGTVEPNRECTCFDRNSVERPFGKYGCLYDWEIDEMNERNRGASASVLEQIRRTNRTK